MKNEFICLIPQDIDLESIINSNPPKFKPFKKDTLAYFIWLIIQRSGIVEDFIHGYYIKFYSRNLGKTAKNYKHYFLYLKEIGVIDINEKYQVKGFPKSYRLKKHSNLKSYTIIDKTLLKNITLNIDKKEVVSYLENQKIGINPTAFNFMFDWITNGIEINYKDALTALNRGRGINPESNKIDIQHYYSKASTIYRFQNRIGFISRTKADNRIHTNFSNFPKISRKYLTFQGEKLVYFDIKTSQPFMSCVLFKTGFYNRSFENKPLAMMREDISATILSDSQKSRILKVLNSNVPDIYEYVNTVVNSDIYLEFGRLCNDSKKTRDQLKKLYYATVFSSNSTQKRRKDIFSKTYPSVWEIFEIIKEEDYKNLSYLLFKIESHIVLDKLAIGWLLKHNNKVPIFSLHDALVTTDKYADELEKQMYEIIKNYVGHPPIIEKEIFT